jgi:sugar lactone lactonase YvrE
LPTVSEPRVWFRSTATLVESILWDAAAGLVRWVDIEEGEVHSADVDGGGHRMVRVPAPVSAIQPAASGRLVASLADSIVEIDAEGAAGRTIATVSHAHPDMRLNEGKCDPQGRFVVGSLDKRGGSQALIYRVSADGALEVLREGIDVSNGFEWDGTYFYFTDTSEQTVYRATYGDELGEAEPFLVGRPSDGLARDSDGGFWNGLYGEGLVAHWNSDGRIDLEIPIPVPQVTSVALIGSTLLVGTARENLDDEALERFPLSGSIFAVDTDTEGVPAARFGTPRS